MDRAEAEEILATELARVRGMSYAEIRTLIKDSEHVDVTGKSGTEYQVESQAMWDSKPEGDLRVMVSIDDGGWRAVVPLTRSFIIAPDGSLVFGPNGERSHERASRPSLLSRISSLFKRPEPAGPPTPVREFSLADEPITRDGLAVDGDSWRIDFGENRSVRLFEVSDPGTEGCVLTYRALMKTSDVNGRVYLEMWCRLPGRGDFFSKGIHNAVSGTTGWASYDTPFFLKKGQRPDLIRLNIACEGAGTVWAKDVVLVQTPTN